MAALAPGSVLADRYRIIRPIRAGGMGAVYEAMDVRLRNSVAVKQMTIAGAEADRAFEREARFLAGLRHAALVVVIDTFVDDERRFLVMQYLEGEDLGQLIARLGPREPGEVVTWGVSLLDALVYLHRREQPIVHRDIKPGNIKLTPRGEIVLLDFGLATGRVEGQTTIDNDDRSLIGFTPRYAPLEQSVGRSTDPRSDLYSLGATLYHLLTGAPPADARERALANVRGLSDPTVPPFVVQPRVGERLSAVVMKAIAIDRIDRYQSAAEMRDALRSVSDGRRPAAPGDAPRGRRLAAAGARRLAGAAAARGDRAGVGGSAHHVSRRPLDGRAAPLACADSRRRARLRDRGIG